MRGMLITVLKTMQHAPVGKKDENIDLQIRFKKNRKTKHDTNLFSIWHKIL